MVEGADQGLDDEIRTERYPTFSLHLLVGFVASAQLAGRNVLLGEDDKHEQEDDSKQ